MRTRPTRALPFLLLGLWVGLLLATPALAQSLLERKKGLYGSAADSTGAPVSGVKVHLSEREDLSHPLVVEIKDGQFVYPRLEQERPTNYYIRVVSDEWYVKRFHFRVRRMNGELFQDDSASLTPSMQGKMPPIRYRGGNAIVEFVLEKVADYQATRQATAPAAPARPEASLDQELQELVALGDLKGAIAKLDHLLVANPGDAERRWQKALLLSEMGEDLAAIKEGQALLTANPEFKGARPRLADWLAELGQTDLALQHLHKESELDPGNASIQRRLTTIYGEVGRSQEAEQAAAKWIELTPDDAEALIALAQLLAGRNDFSGAEELYRKAAEKDPANAYRMFYNVGAAIWNRNGDMKLAVAAFEKSIALKPDYPRSHLLMAYCLLQQGSLAAARRSFERFLELAPSDKEAPRIKKDIQGLPKE